jgi:hypothetical protein
MSTGHVLIREIKSSGTNLVGHLADNGEISDTYTIFQTRLLLDSFDRGSSAREKTE